MSDRVFVYRPGFEERGQRYFCPYSAQIIGMLAYYPAIRPTIELVELDFAKPRRPLVELLGEAHQAAPMLVLDDTSVTAVEGVTVATANGHRFVSKTSEILRYLSVTRGVPLPH